MTRSKKSKAKGLQSHGQGNSNPSQISSSACSPVQMDTNLKRTLGEDAEDAENASNQAKKRSINGLERSSGDGVEQSVQPSPVTKRRPQDENPGSSAQPPPAKKVKQSHTQQLPIAEYATTSAPTGAIGFTKNPKRTETSTKLPTEQIPTEVQHLTRNYDFTPMSVISSSKMEHKVRNVLERVSKFTFSDAKTKPGVVILHAQSKNASKMVSIAELSKREIEKEKGKWWQYSRLEGQVMEMKEKPKKLQPAQGGKTLAMCEDEQSSGRTVEPCADVEMGEALVEPTTEEQSDNAGDLDSENEEEEEEEAFETMAAPANNHRVAALPDTARTKVRAVPVMTIYLARVPVPGLSQLYGEQKNSLAP